LVAAPTICTNMPRFCLHLRPENTRPVHGFLWPYPADSRIYQRGGFIPSLPGFLHLLSTWTCRFPARGGTVGDGENKAGRRRRTWRAFAVSLRLLYLHATRHSAAFQAGDIGERVIRGIDHFRTLSIVTANACMVGSPCACLGRARGAATTGLPRRAGVI